MVNETRAELLLVDPSLLLSTLGLNWLGRDSEVRGKIVVSAAFRESLTTPRDRLSYPLGPSEELGDLLARRDLLIPLLEGVEIFSHEAADLPNDRVTASLLSMNDPDAEVFADEWAYLQTHSWMISALHRPLEAFRHAGAAVFEFGERLRDRLIEGVIPAERMPDMISKTFLTRVGAKWLVVKGVPYVGLALGALFGIPVPEIPTDLLPLSEIVLALDS